MRTIVLCLAVLMALPVVALAADTVTVSGAMVFNAIHRENVTDYDEDQPDQENFVDTYLTLDVRAELCCNVTALVELDNTRHSFDRFGQDGFNMPVSQAWVELREIIMPQLTAKFGMQNFAYELREDGNYFLLNTSNTFFLNAGLEDPSESIGNNAGGLTLTFDLVPQALSADLFWFRAFDPGSLSPKGWFDALGGVAQYVFSDERSKIQFTAINFHDRNSLITTTSQTFPFSHSEWWALSPGISYFIPLSIGDLELYGEAAWETGEWEDSVLGFEDQDLEAFGGRVGAELFLKDMAWQPWVEISYWYLSGDDDPEDGKQKQFVTYGVIAESLIMEDAFYGLAGNSTWDFADTNESVWRANIAVRPLDSLKLKLQYDHFDLAKDTFDFGEGLADELDFWATYRYSPNLTFMLGLGIVWPDDTLKDLFGDDNAFLADLRTTVTF